MATTATFSQLSSYSSINRTRQLLRPHQSILRLPSRAKLSIVMSVEGRGAETFSSEINTTNSYVADDSTPYVEQPKMPQSEEEPDKEGQGRNDALKVYGSAKIHDFCFGIPFGSFVLIGGLLGFIFSRNPTSLGTGVLGGGALLTLSTYSLKIWRQGKSSLPYVLGQAVLSAALCWRSFQAYSLTKSLPAGFYAVISAGMVCFYLHVILSGGNPPPKKLHSSAKAASY